ncbi:MAG: hypothetical protein EA401_06215 [Planctomycetota bacterium]|nr:MAG: hypothetical protein EA401_06215 [Planctomycetota bacterium]
MSEIPPDSSPAKPTRQERLRRGQVFEERLPAWQRWVNAFCENWIFAFIIALALRQFFIEAYRIPTASMEPALYGDVALSKADHVVVDKMGFRFIGPKRWGVVVFQYPVPEVEGPHGREMPAITPDGERLDSFPFRPLLQRNFVKRCVAMPGDTFFIRYGDVYQQQDDGSFAVTAKPPGIQEALWLPIYRHGEDSGYVPWRGRSSTAEIDDGGSLLFSLRDDQGILFDQPLRNIYVKPGPVNVRPRGGGGQWQQQQVSLTQPQFSYNGRTGNIYDLDRWEINRLTTADLDSQHYGSSLNMLMRDLVGDVRLHMVPQERSGTVELILAQGGVNRLRLRLDDNGWTLSLGDEPLAQGDEQLIGRHIRLALVDNTAQAWLDDTMLMEPQSIVPVDPSASATRTRIQLRGEGVLRAQHVAVDRDVYYTADGILTDQSDVWHHRLSAMASRDDMARFEQRRMEVRMIREQFVPHLANPNKRESLLASMQADNRQDPSWLQGLAICEETAITVPDNAYLMLGDNSPFSADSRNWGWVPGTNMRGRVFGVVFPRWTRVR